MIGFVNEFGEAVEGIGEPKSLPRIGEIVIGRDGKYYKVQNVVHFFFERHSRHHAVQIVIIPTEWRWKPKPKESPA